MPSKLLGLFPASLSRLSLFCRLQFGEITNKTETCLVAVAVAKARPPPDEYETDSGDAFSDREDEGIAPVTVSVWLLRYAYSRYVLCFTGENIFCLLLSSQRACLGECNRVCARDVIKFSNPKLKSH